MRDLFWKVDEEQGGPDALFVAHFELGDAQRLAELVRAFPLSGLVRDDIPSGEPNEAAVPALSYVDEWTYQKLVAQQDTGKRENIYIYLNITVEDHQISIVRGSSGAGGSGSATTLLAAIAQSDQVTLTKWEAWQYGYGSGSDRIWAEGTSGQELLDYLQTISPPALPHDGGIDEAQPKL